MTWFLLEALSNLELFGSWELFWNCSDGMMVSHQSNRPMQVHSLKQYPLELSLSSNVEGESGIDSPLLLYSTAPGNDAYSGTSSGDETIVWLCHVCNASQEDIDMISCDLCDDWFHFRCP